LWEQFRRHLVDLHYDELSQWVTESGIDRDRTFSSQGFGAPEAVIRFEPFPLRIDSPPKSYDTGGMSVRGAVPSHGHLGAILYGESAVNSIRMEGPDSLFRVFRDFDPDWAVVEYNTADFRAPKVLPDAGRAYRGLRDIANYGARMVSPMAWNGSPGSAVADPGFVAYTSYRAAPLETAVRNFMVNRANLPRQARLWGFGLGMVIDDDGWKALRPASARPAKGALEVSLATGRTRVDSPPALDFRTNQLDAVIIGIREPALELRHALPGRQFDEVEVADGSRISGAIGPRTRMGCARSVRGRRIQGFRAMPTAAASRRRGDEDRATAPTGATGPVGAPQRGVGHGRRTCDVATLKVGTKVLAADLTLSAEGPVWSLVVFLTPKPAPAGPTGTAGPQPAA